MCSLQNGLSLTMMKKTKTASFEICFDQILTYLKKKKEIYQLVWLIKKFKFY